MVASLAPVVAGMSAAASSAAPSFMSSLSSVAPFISSFTGLFGGGSSGPKQPSFQDQVDVQKQFAKHGIRWRVEDAIAAGVHPLYALGANTTSFSPVSVGGSSGRSSGERFAQFGQDITRAIDTTRTGPERLQARLGALAVQRGELENILLASQIARLNGAGGSGTVFPGIDVQPSKSISPSSNRGVEAAAPPGSVVYVGYDGRPMMAPNQQLSESMEGNWPVGMFQNLAHNTVPFYWDRFKKFARENNFINGRNRYNR